jgi:hypothetical protein
LYALDGRVPICKSCINKEVLTSDGQIDEERFKNILRQIDKPYYKDNLQSAINQFKKENGNINDEDIKYYGGKIIGLYFTKINSLRQLRNKTYADSEKDGFIQKNSTILKKDKSYDSAINNTKIIDSQLDNKIEIDFEVTDEIIDRFGYGFSKIEYQNINNKYLKLQKSYPIKTDLHEESLVTYVRFKVKEEMATARGDEADAKKWYEMAKDAAVKAKLTPEQLKKTDLNGGVNSFSEIFKAVEESIDVIPILPHFKYRPNDACDFIIWCYVNYIRNLQGLPECTYEELYKFYDKKKEEYISQYGDPYGIFTDDPTEELRESVSKFITLPLDYNSNSGDD